MASDVLTDAPFAEAPASDAGARQHRRLLADARDGLEARYIAERLDSGGTPLVVMVTRDAQRAQTIGRVARFVAPGIEALHLPAWDCLPYDRVSPGSLVMAERLRTLARLASGRAKAPRLLLVSANAAVQKVPPPEAVRGSHLSVRAGGRHDRDLLIRHLEQNGYARSGTVVEAGEYAVRGGLLDVFPSGARAPLRLDFFGSTLETIRRFDPSTQRTLDRVERLDLWPVSEALPDAAAVERFKAAYPRAFGAVADDPLYAAISEGRSYPGMEHWLPLFHDRLATVFDYLEGSYEVALDHLAEEAIASRLALIGEHYEARRAPEMKTASFGAAPYRALPPHDLYLAENQVAAALRARPSFQFTIFAPPPALPAGISAVEDLEGRPPRDFAPERADRAINLFDAIVSHVDALKRAGEAPILAAYSEGSAERLSQVLADHGLDPPRRIDALKDALAGSLSLAVLPLDHGVIAPGLHVLGEQDLLGERIARSAPRPKRKSDKFIPDVGALKEDDLVVHVEHGIGRFEGLVTLEVGGAPHDCLKLVYQGGDRLFVPVENLDILTRYGHGGDGEAGLDRLGGAGWQGRKARIKERIKELAGELIAIAAKRARRKGEAFQLPPGVYDEFTAGFPFEETEDQLRAIEAVLDDLASGHPMDRLICGDVGFGKTEVALRAAFVVAMSGKQVALLAPTTLLARQHYATFADRMRGLPLRVAQMSRFVTAKDQAAVKAGLASGEIDVVVGTHALLGKGVAFRDLGLVIVDEEQHFGVAHKERLKRFRAQVHVLTMTATPIPRTLHMALGGMKDLSIIATPPVDRLAVRSLVMPTDPVVIREAILREHHRGGQTFYVCPRVADQFRLKTEIEKLVPEVTLGVANGQMPPRDLEAVMGAFYEGRIDVLLATNIVESGLDIPRANTLIVHRADQFGLSQLYQLKGRVGRSKVRAYAYFTVPPQRQLRETAERRLQVIQSLEGLGAGFQLASHDLDIRGAGNLLGGEQSGNVKEVGFELYNQMLEEAMTALQGEGDEPAATDWTPQITIDAAALMPESYIGDIDLRLAMYRRLAKLETPAQIDDFAAELADRFGPVPPETAQLLDIVAIKAQCRRACVQKLDAGPKGIVLAFHDNRFPHPERLVGMIASSKGTMRVRPDHKLVLLKETASPKERLRASRRLVDELARLAG